MSSKPIPDIIIGRLPVYLRALRHMQSGGKQTTSSSGLGDLVGYSAAQIRKDLSQFGEFGKQGTGYPIPYLIERLSAILHVDRSWDMAVIGMGDMGHAIARYQGFSGRGFRVAMLFDADPEKVGSEVGGLVIQDGAGMVNAIRQAGIRIAVLCVPASAAQAVANDLVDAGIRSILSYSPINLIVPPQVHVQYVDPSIGLQRMAYYLD